ncbi:phage tail tube protein [Lactococcus cremoris]|nr:phage tail tube protein [Lactococcus cremoris]ADJ60132.1 cell wall surface anchor family protein [Lactococcus cremoris subsp. cremoris NZ9000]MCZ7689024.1 Ig-like domain-containing protein [Lactococcus cremoris]MCZ7690973.1 Ig-like domain-containing protein [Lactococcus cremoris]
MEMQKKKAPRKKGKVITKRKVLSATMSGTLLMTSVIIPTAYSLLSNQITAKAAALNIDLLQNITSSNNSGTTTSNRWASGSGTRNVDFTIAGGALANVALLSGPRYAVLTIPQELRGYVVANGNTSVTTNITIDFNKVALINAIVSAGDTFVAGVATILGNNPLASINLTEVTTQLNLLKGIQNIGGGTFTSATTLNGNSMLSAPLNDGMGAILAQNVRTILENLRTAVSNLSATGLAAPAANTALALIKPALITAIDNVLVPLVNGTGGILDLLLNASALGDTRITIPTKITAPPSIQSNLDARFVGSAVQTNLLDVDILSGADGVSYVYLAGDVNLTLVAPTGNLTATTSAVGASNATATIPTTLKNSAGTDVPVTSVITNFSGTPVTNGQLSAGTYTVTYSAAGYANVTQTLVVTDPADTTPPAAPIVSGVTGNSTNGYTVTGTAEPNSTITIKNGSGTTVGTGTTDGSGNYTVTLPGSVGPNAPLNVTATDSSGNVSTPTPTTTPADPVSPVLVAPTGNLTATTSAVGASNATATIPTTLKNSAGADVAVTSVITNSSGNAVTNGNLSAGTYTVTYSATGYEDVTQTLVVSDPTDTTAPDAPVVGSVTGNSTNGYTVTGTAEPNSTITIKDNNGDTVGTGTTDGSGNYTVTLPGSGGPNAPLNVTATDNSGNFSDPASATTPADPTLVTPTGNLTATTSTVGAADATATLPTSLKDSTGADIPVTSVITNSSGAAVTNGNLSAGTYTVTYTAAGYEDVTQTLIVSDPTDTTAPDAPTVGSVTGNSTNGYTVTGTAEPNSTITIKDNNGDTVGTGTTDGSGNYTVTLSGTVGPNAPLNITATDSSGNVSDPTSATTPADPVSPVLVAPTGNLTATTSAVGAADAMATLPASLKDSTGADIPVTSVITNSSGTAVTNGNLSAGTYTVTYTAAGYEDVTQTLVVSDPADTTAPDAPTVGSVTGNSTNGYTVTGTAEPNSTITIKDNNGDTVGTGTTDGSGNYTVTLPGSVGPNAPLTITATDSSGNVSDPTSATTPADPTLVAPTGNLTAITSAVGAADAMATLPASLKDSTGADIPVTSVITNSSGTAVTNGNLSAGTYTVTYTAAGYEDVTQTLIVSDPADTTAPDAPTVGNVTGNRTNGYTVTGTAEPNSTITIKDNNGDTIGTGTTDESGNYTVTLPGSVGPNTPLNVTATDSSGNVSDPTSAITPADPDTTAPDAPVVGSVTGNSTNGYTVTGTAEPNSTITIKDNNGDTVGTGTTDGSGNYTVTLPGSVGPNAPLTITATDGSGNVSDPTSATTPADPVSPVLVAPTGNLTATTSKKGAADATVSLPATLKDSEGKTVPVTHVITNSAGMVVPNGKLSAGTYTVTYSAEGYANVTQTLVVSDPSNPASPVLVAPTGNLTATTSKKGAADATASLPATLKDSDGKTVSVTHVITNSAGMVVPNGKLSAGTYTVTYSAEGYANVTQTLVVNDPSSNTDTTAPSAPTVDSVTGDSGSGYTVNGKGEPGSTITVKNPATGEVLGTAVAGVDGSYTIKLPLGINPGTQLSVTATDASGNTSEPTLFTTPPTTMNGGMINGNMSTNIGGKHFSTADLPATGEANAGWLSMVGTVLLSLFGAMFFWRKKNKEDKH